jgi:hypothetical protein
MPLCASVMPGHLPGFYLFTAQLGNGTSMKVLVAVKRVVDYNVKVRGALDHGPASI